MENIEFRVSLKIGKYIISQYTNGEIWIDDEDGEGMPVKKTFIQLYNAIDKYYNDNF